MLGIVSIIHELAELLQQKNREWFVPANSNIYNNLWRAAMKLAFTDDQRGLTWMEKNVIHTQRHLMFLQYCLQDGTILWPVLDGIIMQMNANIHLMPNQKTRYWDMEDLFLQLAAFRQECLQRPIFMLPPVAVDPRSASMLSQRERILKAVQAIWDDFKIKTHDHVAPKHETSGFLAMVGSNIFLWSWNKILELVVEICNMINMEKDLKPEVGVWAFCQKRVEMFRQGVFIFMCGDRRGSRSAALQMLLPQVHVATYDAAAA